MASSNRVLNWLCASITLVVLAGCGGGKPGIAGDAADATMRSRLGEVHDLVFGYYKSHQQQAPKKLADLQALEKMSPAGFQAIKDQSIVLIYGVPPDTGSSAILAYVKDADKQGGLALLANGNVKRVSADDVKAAEKK